jgi:hypothetical protein
MHVFCAMILGYRLGIAGLIALSLVSCATRTPVQLSLPKVPKGPLPGAPTVIVRRDVPHRTSKPLTITRLVIGLGSGLNGFNSVELSSDGQVTVVLDDPILKHRYIKASSVHPLHGVTTLLRSQSVIDCLTLGSSYTTGLNDGTQGFLCLEDEHGKAFTFCDNAFPPAFRVVWEKIGEFVRRQPNTTWRIKKGISGFTAYRNAERSSVKSVSTNTQQSGPPPTP